jgi:nitrite reductase/ring-hydroxylating ferredoxin subunit/uncharacterized membrane protein
MNGTRRAKSRKQSMQVSGEPPAPINLHEVVDPLIDSLPDLQRAGTDLKSALHQAILDGGEPTRRLADVLHGKWLGHPLHPLLTDVTIGAWLFGALFDVLSLLPLGKRHRATANTLTTIGTISAVPTALAGLTDFSAIKRDAVAYGTLHGLLNSAALLLYILSLRARANGQQTQGVRLALMGFAGLLASAWLGGEMSYHKRVGVNHAPMPDAPHHWTPVLNAEDLSPGQSRRVSAGGYPVLLYHYDGQIYAMGAVCAHAGGPLEKGKFAEGCVTCPWHDSVYDMRTGQVVHGPSTYSEPRYEVRVHNTQIEVRLPAPNPEASGVTS